MTSLARREQLNEKKARRVKSSVRRRKDADGEIAAPGRKGTEGDVRIYESAFAGLRTRDRPWETAVALRFGPPARRMGMTHKHVEPQSDWRRSQGSTLA